MLSIETRVNGNLISHLYIHNEMIFEGDKTVYSVEYYRINKEPAVIKFVIKHNRSEGAEKLSLLIYREIDKRLKKEKNPKRQ
jgi:hypothetical protein